MRVPLSIPKPRQVETFDADLSFVVIWQREVYAVVKDYDIAKTIRSAHCKDCKIRNLQTGEEWT